MPNRLKKCCYCKELFDKKLMEHHPKGYFCIKGNHALKYSIERSNKLRAKKEKVQKQKDREVLNNDYSYQFGLAKKAAQKLANTLDRHLGCISCDCGRTVQFCGGHFRTAGAHRELALDLRNIHGQCNRNCNMGLSGNIGGTKKTRGYRVGLLERYGPAFVEFLEAYRERPAYTAKDVRELAKTYRAETRRLEQGLPPSRDWRALPKAEEIAA